MLAGPDPGPLPILTLDPATHAAMLDGGAAGWFAATRRSAALDVTAANVHGAAGRDGRRACC